MNLPDFLQRGSLGEILLKGHRISLYDVVTHYNAGYSELMLAETFPSLSLDLIRDVISFYRKNEQEIDEYVAGIQAECDRLRANGKHLDLEKLRERFKALHGE